MRKKQRKLIVTFHTTAEAMALDKLSRQLGLPGRLIPAPREVTSDCGVAWCAGIESRAALEAAVAAHALETDEFFEVYI